MRISFAAWRPYLLVSLIIWVFLIVTVCPLTKEIKAAWIIGLTILFWATNVLPQWFTALLFFVLCAVAHIVSHEIFLSGVISPAVWLLIAGSIIGLSIQHTGLGKRLAALLLPLMTTYRRALLGSALLGLFLIFLMPSAVGRIMVMLPILMPLTEQLGYGGNTRARNGILLAAVMATFFPAFTVLPANVPNNVLLGLVKTLFSEAPTYGEYLWLHFPILGGMKLIILLLLLNRFYQAPNPKPVKSSLPTITRKEKILLLVLLATLLLWITEAQHGIETAWVAMLAGVFCLSPGLDLTPKNPLKAIPFETFFYVAAIVSLGALAYHSGLAGLVADQGLKLLPLRNQFDSVSFAIFSSLSTLLSMAVTLPGTPAILTPLTQELSHLSGWSLQAVYMSQVIGFSTVIFPFQSPPLVVAMQMAKISQKEMMRLLGSITVLTVIVLWPLDYLWWQWLGVL